MSRVRLLLGAVLFAFACGGDSPPPTHTVPTATLTGDVREDGSGVAIAGAKVAAGTVTATSDQNGRFELRNAPIGASIAITVSAVDFDTLTRSMAIREGSNTLTAALVRRIWESGGIALYLPRDVSLVRGVYFFLGGGRSGGGVGDTSLDMRPFVRGDLGHYGNVPGGDTTVKSSLAAYRTRFLEATRTHAFGLIGAHVATQVDYPYEKFLQALDALASLSGHDELRHAPLLPVGMSLGGIVALEMALAQRDRVIGFIAMKGVLRPGNGMSTVPGYLFIGSLDEPTRNEAITTAFEAYRANNAPWALAIEPQVGHTLVSDLDLLFHWMEDITALRLPASSPPGSPVALRPIDVTSGWLGHRSSFQIATHAAFTGDKLKAAWLPTARTATEWRAMMGPRE